jgi:uncharacterized hydrophobic protein (TIGR00271 family)
MPDVAPTEAVKKPETTEEKEKKGDILKVSTAEQFKTVGELFERAQPNSVYYTLLVLSIFIVVTGILLENAPIVIGGMLVTPVLTPILVIALSIIVGEVKAIKGPGLLILKSIILTIGISIILTFAFGLETIQQNLPNTMRTAILYFIVATTSGMAATFAWVRKDIAEIMPGISIAVSLVPPLSLIGIYLGLLDLETARFFLLIFVLNFVGILLGSMIVFSLLKFQRSGWEVHRQVQEAEKIQASKEAKKTAVKVKKKIEQIKENVKKIEELEESGEISAPEQKEETPTENQDEASK